MMKNIKHVYATIPEEDAWAFKERVTEYRIKGGINGVLKPYKIGRAHV